MERKQIWRAGGSAHLQPGGKPVKPAFQAPTFMQNNNPSGLEMKRFKRCRRSDPRSRPEMLLPGGGGAGAGSGGGGRRSGGGGGEHQVVVQSWMFEVYLEPHLLSV